MSDKTEDTEQAIDSLTGKIAEQLKELASLREQLKLSDGKLESIEKEFYATNNKLVERLKQKEDENRELLDSMSQLIYAMNTTGLPWNTDSTAEKAYAQCRSLLKKHTG